MTEILPTLESLEQLDFSCNDLGRTCMKALGSILAKFPNLKKLVWIKSLFTVSLIKAFRGRNIEIKLVDNKKSKSSEQEGVTFHESSQSTTKVDDINIFLSYFQAHPDTAALVQEIDLGENNIGDAGAQALAVGLQHCTNLQTLYLYKNSIGDAGAQALAEGLLHCTKLQVLQLSRNNIGDTGAHALVEGLQHYTNLQKLYLMTNSLTDSSVGSLSQLIKTAKQLKKLDLYSNKFTGDGMRALKAAAEERNSNPDFVKLELLV